MQGRFAENPAYVEYESLLKKLHALIAEGKCDSDEADAVRESMDAPERLLNRAEKDRLNGLSADLYMLQGEEALQSPPIDANTLKERVAHAQARNDWEAVLNLLRHRSPEEVPTDVVAIKRSRAYDALGHPDTALLFLDFGYRHKADEPHYQALRLRLLADAGRVTEAEESATRILSEAHRWPAATIVAADVLLNVTQSGSQQERTQRWREILDRLAPVLRETPQESRLTPNDFVLGQLLLAYCHFELQEFENGNAALKAAVDADPADRVMRQTYERARSGFDPMTWTISLVDALNHVRDLARRSGLIAA
jgi:hypothetical protein